MSWLDTAHDKRHAMRVHPPGTVVLHRHDREQRGRIIDLAAGGVAMQSVSSAEHVGDVVALDIALDRSNTFWALSGHIVRIDPASLAIAFDDIPIDLEDYLQDELLELVEVIALPDSVPEAVAEQLRELLLAAGQRRQAQASAALRHLQHDQRGLEDDVELGAQKGLEALE